MTMSVVVQAPEAMSPAVQAAIALAWREAEMLDRLDYKPWLELWTEEGMYIIPTERDETDYAACLNVAYDDDMMRRMRVKRLLSGFSMSSAPPARTVRTVSRFVPEEVGENRVRLRAAMTLIEYKYEHSRILGADLVYDVVFTEDGPKLDRKVVTLLNCDDFLHGLGYLL